jgi:hypothetical protein
MRNFNCRNARREIEDTASAELLSVGLQHHLSNCAACSAVLREQTSLQQLVSSLGTVSAPNDFDFRLRARLARQGGESVRPFALGSLSFRLRSAAVAMILFMLGSALMFISFKNQPTNQFGPQSTATAGGSARETASVNAAAKESVIGKEATAIDKGVVAVVPREKVLSRRRGQFPSLEAGSRDLSGTRAPVLRPNQGSATYQSAAFPIDAAYQSMKVSVDEGRGTERTISLPAVSFGSQRSLSQNPTPLLASARDSW